MPRDDINDLGRDAQPRRVPVRETDEGVSLAEYLRQKAFQLQLADPSEHLPPLTSGLHNSSDENLPAFITANGRNYGHREVSRRNAGASPDPVRLQDGLRRSIWPYVAVAILSCGVSCGAFLYFIANYAAFGDMKGANSKEPMASGDSFDAPQVFKQSTPSRMTAVVATPSPSLEASLLPPAVEPPAAESDRTQDIAPPESIVSAPRNASPVSSSAPAVAVASRSEPDKAALAPSDSDRALVTAPSIARQNPEAKPAAIEESAAKPDTPETYLPKLKPNVEQQMLERASDLMAHDDIAGARLVYRYLANHGSASGAFALAGSYDARTWSGHHVAGMLPDAVLAGKWYARAAALGSKEAAAMLHQDKQ